MLSHASVLVVEDQAFVALDLALAIEDAGGEVVGPAATVEEALELLATITVGAAILDVTLAEGDTEPLMEVLAELGVPTIIQTGVNISPRLAARFPAQVVHIKPCTASKLVAELAIMISRRPAA